MKQEDKDLLLKDLCARLPYNTLISIDGERYRMEEIRNALIGINMYKITIDGCDIEYMDIRPYLFPLSSMTEEQKREYIELLQIGPATGIDWLNANHFDYRGLIPRGLANDATGLNVY